MVQWVDLAHPIETGMPVYPGDPEVEIKAALRVAEHEVNVAAVHMGSQSGTHVDAPYHVDDEWPRLEELPLERFSGPALTADLRGLGPRAPITADRLAPTLRRYRPGAVLLLATGWAAHWGTEYYLAHPWLAPSAASAIVDAGVQAVGVDAASVDRTLPDAKDGVPAGLAAHRVLLGASCVIAENLRGLEVLLDAQAAGRRAEVFLLPLSLAEADGAPVRAAARVL
jgi:kynurenine formamidase